MCWQDYKIGAQLRQSPGLPETAVPSSPSVELPPNRHRVGLAIHGNASVFVRVVRKPNDVTGPLIYSRNAVEDEGAVMPNSYVSSEYVMIDRIGNDLRGAILIEATSAAQSGRIAVNQIEWCGPESLDGGL